MPEIKMPQLGESVVEGTITKWLKKEGEQVSEDELLVEVSTDKVDSEVPSSVSGTIQKILVDEGETVKVGTAIAVVGEPGEAASDGAGTATEPRDDSAAAQPEPEQPQEPEQAQEPKAAESPQAARGRQEQAGGDESARDAQQDAEEAQAERPEAQDTGRGAPEGESQAPPTSAADEGAGAPTDGRAPKREGDTSKRGIISPLVRRLADEHGVDLDEVEGSGTGGRIRKQDVLKYAEQRKSRPAASAASAESAPEPEPAARPAAREAEPAAAELVPGEELVPWTNIRRRTAEHMAASARETARAWNAVEVDWTNVVALRGKAKEAFRQREGFNLTYMPFLGMAVCEALLEMPEVNATFDEANQGNRIRRYVNLGIAVALEGGGLIVPVVRRADEKRLVGLARSINDIVTRARSKKLSPDDLAGGTFTITNPGPFGSVISVPIIPRGQAAILGFEAIEKRVVVTDDDSIAIRSMGFLSLSWDHRIIDGAEAARFLASLKQRIENTDFSAELSQYI